MTARSPNPSDESLHDLLSSDLERYANLEQVGAGGMGVVYRALNQETGKLVAIKTVHRLEPLALLYLKNEFRRLANVAHENLVGLYELASVRDNWFIVMEHVSGRTLKEMMARPDDPASETESTRSPTSPTVVPANLASSSDTETRSAAPGSIPANPVLPLEQLIDVFGQLARGVQHLHAAGVLHCDIKPANAMVTDEGRALLLDFGLAAHGDSTAAETTSSRSTAGTPAYLAPEQLRGEGPSEASDWYAFGLMLFEALAGRRPFPGTSAELVKARTVRDAPRLVQAPGVPADLVRLTNALLSRDPASRPTSARIFEVLKIGSSEETLRLGDGVPLIGREHHLTELESALQMTRESGPVTVHVGGRSGSGKSALLNNFISRVLHEKDTVVLHGRCYERESVPFKAFDALIDSLSRYLVDLPTTEFDALRSRHFSDLARVFPVLRRAGAVETAGSLTRDGQEVRRRAFRALKHLLRAVAGRSTLVVYVDDVQWGDVDSAQLFNELLAPPGAPRMLTVFTYRSEEAGSSAFLREHTEFIGGLGASFDLRKIEVGPLNARQACRLAASLLDVDDSDPVAQQIADEAQGNPLFVEELARHLVGSRTGASSIDDLVRRRVANLPDDARRLITTIAVSGRPLPQSLAAQASGDVTDLANTLNLLRAQKLIRTAGPRPEDLVEAYHDRIRESIWAGLDDEVRTSMHRALAEAHTERDDADPEVLSHHWFGAGDAERGANFAVAAGDRAAASLAFDAAVEFYRQARASRPGDEKLKIKEADALVNAGRSGAAAPLYLDASEGVKDSREANGLRRRAAEQYLISGRIDQGMGVLRPLLAEASLPLPRSPGSALFQIIWRMISLSRKKLEFEPEDLSTIDPALLDQIELCWTAGKGLGSIDIMRGGYYLVRSTQLALKAREPERVSRGLAQVGLMAAARGPVREEEQGRTYLAASERLARESQDPRLIGFNEINWGATEFCVGNFQEACVRLERGTALLEEECSGVAWESSFARSIQSHCLADLGKLAEFQDRVPGFLRTAEENGDKYGALWVRTESALAQMAADEVETARETLGQSLQEGSVELFTPAQLMCLLYMAGLDLYRGRPRAAVDRIDSMWKPAHASFSMGWQFNRVMGQRRRGCAYVALAASLPAGSERNAAIKGATVAAKKLGAERRPYAVASANFLRGLIAHVDGRDDDALQLLQQAEQSCEAAGMGLYVQYARHRRGEILGGDEGESLVSAARQALAEQAIVNAERWLATFAPGFGATA